MAYRPMSTHDDVSLHEPSAAMSGLTWLPPAGGVRVARLAGMAPIALVLGMDWGPVLGHDVRRQAARRARGLRATHYAWGGHAGASVGCARLPGRSLRGWQPHAAALVVASLCGAGTQAVRLRCPPFGMWLVAVHEGAVIAGSDVCHASDDACADALSGLRERYPALREVQLGEQLADLFPDGQDANWPLSPATQLMRAKRAGAGLWLPAAAGASLVLGWHWHMARPAEPVVAFDAAAAWSAIYDEYAQQRRVHDWAVLRARLAALAELPLRRGGWSLERAECRSDMAGWHCHAQYRRAVGAADNIGLTHRWPSSWQVEYAGLDLARVVWREAGGRALDWRRLPQDASLQQGAVAELQRYSLLFDHAVLGESRQVTLSAPLDPTGIPAAKPVDMPSMQQRSIGVSGPLNAFPVLLDLRWPVSWERLALDVRPAPHVSTETPSRQDGGQSRLVAHLQGVIYARQ